MPKNPGKQFEASFTESIPDRCDVTRLKDAGGWSNATNMRFTSSNPCDLTIYAHRDKEHLVYGSYYKFELKSTELKSLPYGNIKSKTDKLTVLERSIAFTKVLVESEKKGVHACFIVNFRAVKKTYMVYASKVLNHLETADRASIPIAWFEENGILIKQTLKIKHYRYDLEWL
jgi:hypothetical protein